MSGPDQYLRWDGIDINQRWRFRRILAMSEDDMPYAMSITPGGDLITMGRYSFNKRLFLLMCTHPKIDPMSENQLIQDVVLKNKLVIDGGTAKVPRFGVIPCIPTVGSSGVCWIDVLDWTSFHYINTYFIPNTVQREAQANQTTNIAQLHIRTFWAQLIGWIAQRLVCSSSSVSFQRTHPNQTTNTSQLVWARDLRNISFSDDFRPAGCSQGGQSAVKVHAGDVWEDVYRAADTQKVVVVGAMSGTVAAAGGYVQVARPLGRWNICLTISPDCPADCTRSTWTFDLDGRGRNTCARLDWILDR
ncbi:hypothetical protein SELMODRAFT_410487 [Selaginella moellendorffii]|uniref:Uncharacterized protein n=1 Tax=Selaginella moellendorffii TaxID=88036 RepID=D8REW8_SELML|nr:hypothetical protein SELMODRAFT_410487 [Selaginella moellendorffii]